MNRIISMLLSVLSVFVVFLPFGNPISDFLVTKSSEIYIEENYGDKDFTVDEAVYDFKTGNYYVNIVSPSSPDSSFTLYADMKGNIGYDTYESAVLKKWNTASRIDDAYRESVDKLLDSGKITFEIDFGFGEIMFRESDAAVDESIPAYAISTEELVLDGVYDTAEMGKRAGKLTVYFYDNSVTAEKMAEILLAIRSTADGEGVCFKAVDCVLQSRRSEAVLSVSGFMYDDIYEQDIVERINENVRNTASTGDKENPV
ncbi:MAG: hypothetical protein IKY78_01490 [Clostridia bacterium]|nr:hypothetical protein [Clostridia bacterium]